MYSNKENVNILTDILVKKGIKTAVVCPGSRNSPIVHNLCTCPNITCYPVTDERSAGFFALGLALAITEPIIICITSGSALLNLAPAIAEAYYQNLSIIVLSADRPQQWINQLDGQTIQQYKVLEPNVRKSVQLIEPHNKEERWYCNRILNESINISKSQKGPIHINIPISEPLFDYTTEELPSQRCINFHKNSIDEKQCQKLASAFLKGSKSMIVIGQIQRKEARSIRPFLEILRHSVVIIQEKLSEDNHLEPMPIDEIITKMGTDESFSPNHLLYIGGSIVSKRLKNFLRKRDCPLSIMVNEQGEHYDTFLHLTDVIAADPIQFLKKLATECQKEMPSRAYVDQWNDVRKQVIHIRKNIQLKFSQLSIIRQFHDQLHNSSLAFDLFYANSSAVRLGNIYSKEYIFVNRGVNGIEGSLSTAVGYATAVRNEKLVFCIIGDLSFFYDQNALWNKNLPNNLRILLLNNGGGGIFHQLKGLERSPYRDTSIAASHNTTAEGICQTHGIHYHTVNNQATLAEGLQLLMSSEEVPILLEVFTKSEDDAQAIRDYYQSF